jgi:hypothetical protein
MVRPLLVENADYTDQINKPRQDIGQMGVVETREGAGGPAVPGDDRGGENLPGAHHGLLAAGARSGAPARLTSDPTNLDAVHNGAALPARPQGLR